MNALKEQAEAFRQAKNERSAEARQCAAFFLVSGIDLAAALQMPRQEKEAVLARIGRLIERERLKGLRRHWSYDLNRHIALKQAYDRLQRSTAVERSDPNLEPFCRSMCGSRSRDLAKNVSTYNRAKARRSWTEHARPFGFPGGGRPLCQAASADGYTLPSPPSAWIASPPVKQN